MDKRFLEDCLAKGMSLETIGERVGRHPSTVGYWLKKHGLKAAGRDRHSPNGAVDQARVAQLVEEGASVRAIAAEFGVGYSTMRYWLGRLGLETARSVRKREGDCAREAGFRRTYLRCPKHGHTAFYARPEGGYRCAKCNTSAVSERRRQVKRMLVDEAGGCCRICGFAEHPAALHFHHVDPSTKEFHLAHLGASRSVRRMRTEASKCVLLCANCHALVEAGVKKLPSMDR
jgi:transposase